MTPERADAIKAYVDALRAYERAPTIRNYSRVMDAIEEIRRMRRLLNDYTDWTEYEMPTLSEQAHKAALESTRTEKPSQFTVNSYMNEKGELTAAVTYDRKISNLWGLTAYAKAYWHDLSITAHPKLEAGVQVTKDF